jgi:uncharacterized protein (TIGR02246 family)
MTTTSSPSPASTASTGSTGLDVRALFERYAAAWTARDPDAIVAFHTEDTQFWLHIDQPPAQGREAVRAAFAEVFEQWPEFGFETHRVLVGADHWVLDWTATAVLTDPDGTRRPVRVDCLDVVCVDAAGLVTRKDTFPDYPQALGAVTPA